MENLIRYTVITKPKRHVDDLWNLTNSVKVLFSIEINDFYGCGSVVVVNLLFNVLSIVYGSSVFVLVLLCITLCPF